MKVLPKVTPASTPVTTAGTVKAPALGPKVQGEPLDALVGSVTVPLTLAPQLAATPQASLPLGTALPAWYPPDFQLGKAAKGMQALLSQKGVTVTPVPKLVVTDADYTLLATTAATLLKHRTTGEHARHPVTNEIFRLGPEFERERAALEAQFPQLPWSELSNDYHEFDDALDIAGSDTIAQTLEQLRASDLDPQQRQFLITARNSLAAISALEQVSQRDGLGLDGVFSANAPAELEALGVEEVKLGTAERKALMIAALIDLHQPSRVIFYDDGDANLSRARELLPLLFPGTTFEFVDVVKRGHHFEHVPV